MSYAQAQKFQSRERNNGRNVQVLVFTASLSKEKGKTASFTGYHWSLCEGTSCHAGGISYVISMIWAWSRTNEHQSLRALIKQTHTQKKNTDATWCNIKCSNCSELRFGMVWLCTVFCTCHFPPTKIALLLHTECHAEFRQHRDETATISGWITIIWTIDWTILSVSGI